ncbi:MAG: hemolysin family protein [Gemmatimonadetes bacterium]|nr:hemolysin family protein [Gemmatimonadota bacterium]
MLATIVQEAHAEFTGGQIALRLSIALLLVLANGFFVAAEFALVGARRTRIDALADAGNARAKIARGAIQHLDHYISGTQLGITLASLALGWVGESTIAAIIIQLFSGVGSPWDALASHTIAVAIAFGIITFLHIVLGELAPKSLALLFPESVSMWLAGPLIVFAKIFTPFIHFLNGSANLILRTVGLRAPREAERVHRPEEIEMLISQTYEHGLLAQQPVEMIRGVFDLSETTAAEVMTPRTQIMAAANTVSLEELENLLVDSGHSRVPIYEGSVDHIIGVVLARDFWRSRRDRRQWNLASLIRTVPFVPETKDLEHLLREMQREGTHIAIVLDEYGGTAGLVTVEDVLEQIVGEIADEHEVQREEIHQEDGRVLLVGRVLVADINERFGLQLPEEEYTTVAGYVMGTLGRIAGEGDTVDFPGGQFRVSAMSGRRVELIEMVLPAKSEAQPEE